MYHRHGDRAAGLCTQQIHTNMKRESEEKQSIEAVIRLNQLAFLDKCFAHQLSMIEQWYLSGVEDGSCGWDRFERRMRLAIAIICATFESLGAYEKVQDYKDYYNEMFN